MESAAGRWGLILLDGQISLFDNPLLVITSAVDTVSELTGAVAGFIAGNPLLCVFAASALLGVGFTNWRRARRAAGG